MSEKPVRHRSKEHLRRIRLLPCLVGGVACGSPVQAHHLTHVQPKARGLKAGDQWVVPLCHGHHTGLHGFGNERLYWALSGIDPRVVAEDLWQETQKSKKGR